MYKEQNRRNLTVARPSYDQPSESWEVKSTRAP